MDFKKALKLRDLLLFTFEVLILEAIILITQLNNVGWNWTQVDWSMFFFTFFVSFSAKFIATDYSSKKTLTTDEILTPEGTIKNLYANLLTNGLTTKFDKVLYYRAEEKKIAKLLAENEKELTKGITLVRKLKDSGKDYKQAASRVDVAKQKHELLMQLNKSLETHSFKNYDILANAEETVSLIPLRDVKVKSVTSANLFTKRDKDYKNSNELKETRFNQLASSFAYNIPFLIGSVAISYFYSCFNLSEELPPATAWVNAIVLSFSLVNGLFSGFGNGQRMIRNDYKSALLNRIKIISEAEALIKYIPDEIPIKEPAKAIEKVELKEEKTYNETALVEHS